MNTDFLYIKDQKLYMVNRGFASACEVICIIGDPFGDGAVGRMVDMKRALKS